MQSLLANKCIKSIDYTPGSNNESGQIFFYGGEIYVGEIEESKPSGWGKLDLPGGSYYEGSFCTTGMTDGRFVLSNSDYFEGKFHKDKLQKGSLHFKDGDLLKGEWGIERLKWNLKSGSLHNSDKVELTVFGKNGKDLIKKAGSKEIHQANERYGFEVKYKSDEIQGRKKIDNLSYTAYGQYYYDETNAEGVFKSHTTHLTAPIPHTIIDTYTGETQESTVYKMCFGFDVETQTGNQQTKLTFKDLRNVHAIGLFNFEKGKFKFKGQFYYKDNELGSLSLKKTTFIDLKVKFDSVIYDSLNGFFKFVKELAADRFKDDDIEVGCQINARKQSQVGVKAMDNVIGSIKSDNNCVIM